MVSPEDLDHLGIKVLKMMSKHYCLTVILSKLVFQSLELVMKSAVLEWPKMLLEIVSPSGFSPHLQSCQN